MSQLVNNQWAKNVVILVLMRCLLFLFYLRIYLLALQSLVFLFFDIIEDISKFTA
jgi:hypothetical protein